MDCVFIRAVDAADLSRTSGSSGLMRSAVLCFCNFSRQGQSLFNLLGKDEPVSEGSAGHFSLWCNSIPAAL